MNTKLGVIEGFYGEQWSWGERVDYAGFLRKHGFSFYIYAPKADGYLRKKWREPFPKSLEEKLTKLAGQYHSGNNLWRVEDERDRAVIDQLDLHIGPENAARDGTHALGLQGRRQAGDQRSRQLGPGCIDELRPAAFASRAIQGELGDHQRAPAGIKERSVKARWPVHGRENPQDGDLLRQPIGLRLGVGVGDPDQEQDSRADLAHDSAIDPDRGAQDAL